MKTHCINGHEYTPENTIKNRTSGKRLCVACQKDAKKRHYDKHRDKIRLRTKQWRLNNPEQAKNNDLKKKYGITLERKQEMLVEQGGRCAACRTTEPGGKYNEWNVDHNHTTSKVRALLCFSCNATLGWSNENIFRLEALAEYLRKHNQ